MISKLRIIWKQTVSGVALADGGVGRNGREEAGGEPGSEGDGGVQHMYSHGLVATGVVIGGFTAANVDDPEEEEERSTCRVSGEPTATTTATTSAAGERVTAGLVEDDDTI